jgi:NTE family protein
MSKSIALVLGSGGARGLAHIGVIKYLKEHHYDIKGIAGTSIGALIGGVFAAEKLDVLEDWMVSLKSKDVISLLDISWSSSGFVKGDKIMDSLKELLGNQTIEKLKIPFTAVAVDIKTEKEIWLNHGSLFNAIRASASLPLFFTPVDYNGYKLVDGGVLNPVPIAPTFEIDCDKIIAVNLNANPERSIKEQNIAIRKKMKAKNDRENGFTDKIANYIKNFSISDNPSEKDWSMYDVASHSFDAMQTTISRNKLAAYPPDVLIDIPRNACGTFEFERAEEMIEMGYNKAKEVLKD